MLDDKKMNDLLTRCLTDPELKRIFESFMETSQSAAKAGMKVEEMASICMMGYAIGQDPELQEMVKNMVKILKVFKKNI